MNKTFVIGGVVVLALVVGFIMLSKDKGGEERTLQPNVADTSNVKTESKTTGARSLRSLMGLGTALKCTYGIAQDGVTGVSYIANGKVRTDAEVHGRTTETFSSIMDSEYIYTWGSALPEGMKMKISDMEAMGSAKTSGGQVGQQGPDLDTSYDYNCDPWTVDARVLTPPSNVTFTDYGEMMKGVQGMMKGYGSDAGMMDGEMFVDPTETR